MADQNWFRKTSGWLIRHKQRIGILATGYAGLIVEEILFDWLLYGTINEHLTRTHGMTEGSYLTFLFMCPLSALVCYFYIRLYDWAKKDWFGFEAVQEVRDRKKGLGIMQWLLRFGDVGAFFALNIFTGPFTATAYLRRSSGTYNGLSKRDWRIFWLSVLFSNAYWTLRMTLTIEALRFLWRAIT